MSGGGSPKPEQASAGEGAIEPARRRRLHWLCARACGDRVLDASGDGAAALLLAGEGRTAAAVEREPGALEEARRQLGSAPGVESARVEVVANRPGAPGVEADAFDTVLIGDGLEDVASIAPSLMRARRALRSGGRVAIAVPYGTNRWLDRDEPAHLRPLLAALGEQALAVEEVELAGGQLGIVARVGEEARLTGSAALAPWLDALDAAHRRLAEHRQELDRQREELARREREALVRSDELEKAERRRARLKERLDRLEERQRTAQARAEDLRERLSKGEAELGEAKEAAARERARLDTLRASRSFRLVRLLWRARTAVRRGGGPDAAGGDEPSTG